MANSNNMKTLYITDLDGTLLNGKAELSGYTVEALNRMITRGVDISVATARTAATALPILKEVKFKVPLVLMNGVLIYDPVTEKYIKKEVIPVDIARRFINSMHEAQQPGLMYTLCGEDMRTYFEPPVNDALCAFIDERRLKYNKSFTQVSDFLSVTDDVIYFCFLDNRKNIESTYSLVNGVEGMRVAKSRNIYSEGQWFIEIFNDAASKRNATQFLRGYGGYGRVIGFGDDTPDISLFEACDEGYAMENAIDELKMIATGVIGSNSGDSVVKWIEDDSDAANW